MKKHLLLLAVAALSFGLNTAKAQVMPVSGEDGFEVWKSDALNGAARDPNNGNPSPSQWQCLNLFSSSLFGSNPVSVFQDSATVHGGKYSCKIVSIVLKAATYSYVSAFIPHDTMGIVMGGTITGSAFKLGVPFNRRITQFNFWYQYTPQTGAGKPDTASCTIGLTHKGNILGGGLYLMNSAGSWTYGTVPITYDSATGSPDTIVIVFNSSSYFKPVPGSVLLVDDVSVPAGLDEVSSSATRVDVYPNPAATEVNFRVMGKNAHSVKVYDITGKNISAYNLTNNMVSVNTSGYSPGLYIYQVYDKNGVQLNVGKFSVVR